MVSVIKKLHPNGEISDECIYTLEPKKALVCAIEQLIYKNWDTWKYPELIKGMWSPRKDTWYFDNGDFVLGATIKNN